MSPVMRSAVGQTRLEWVDAAKGLGIILVVYGHVARGIVASSGIGDQTILSRIDYTIYTFHMPLFFFLAGLFAQHSYDKGKEAFWIGKLHTIAYPYFLWSLIQGSLLILFSQFTNSHPTSDRLFNILWTPIAPFWFLYALFLCHVLFALLRTLNAGALLLCASSLYVVGEFYRLDAYDPSFLSNLDMRDTLNWSHPIHGISVIPDTARGFLYYTIGVLGSRGAGKQNSLTLGWVAPIILAFSLAATAGLLFGIPYETNVPAALLGIATIVLVCRACAKGLAPIEYLGRRSMPIYVMHIAIAAGVRILLTRFGHIPEFWPNLILGLLLGLLVPCLAYNIADRVGFAGWLGFNSLRRRFIRAQEPSRPPSVEVGQGQEI